VADRLQLMVEAERRGILPPDKVALLAEARRRGLVNGGPKTHDGLPAVRNQDGSYSTELSITVTDPRLNGGRPTNIPSLWGGRVLEEGDAVGQALASGKRWNSFNSIEEAVEAAKARSTGGGAGFDGYAAPPVGGMGGFNPMARRLMGGTTAVTESLGMTPENTANPIANAAGIGEMIPQAVTGTAATVAGGIAGIGQGIKNLVAQGMPAGERVRQVQEALTYQPRTGAGRGMARAVGAPGEIWQAGTNRAGEFVAEKTGSPAAGALIKTAGDIAPAIVGARASGVKRPSREPKGDYKPPKAEEPPVPTTEQLTQASRDAYAAGKESGVVVPADSFSKALAAVKSVAKNEGVSAKLHPKTAALLEHLDEASGKDLSITEAENLRRVIQEVAGDLDPVTRKPTADAFRASKMLDVFDDAVDQLSVNADARALWSRSRKSQMIDDMIERAQNRAGANYTQAGMETALRQEFKQLLMNPRRMRGFTKEQKAAIAKVVRGGAIENSLRALGKFDPTTGGMGTAVSVVAAGGLAPVTGGASIALPAIGFGAKRLATRATARNVEAAREALVGRGLPTAEPRTTAGTTQPRAAAQGATASTQARSVANIRVDIADLAQQVREAARTSRDAPEVKDLVERLVRLQDELKLAVQRESDPSANGVNPDR
jgi:hypothetical protein